MPAKSRSKTTKSKTTKKRAPAKRNGRSKAAKGRNVEKLVKAGVLDAANLTEKHRKIIDTKLSAAEIKALIKAKKLLRAKGDTPWQPDADGASF